MIRFHEAVLVRFGKFTDFTLSFSDGFQVIYGKNEAGKSTIQLFLKVMLYGASGSKKESKALKIRERMIPWEAKSAEGILRFELDGRMMELRRKFGKTSSGDKAEIVDFHTGEPIREIDAKCVGEELLGVPESVFEKTLWIQQGTAAFSGRDAELSERLMNLLETGAEDFSAEGVLIELEEEIKELKAKTKRNKAGEIDRLWDLREEKIQERYRLLSERKQRDAEENVLKLEKQKLEELKQEELRLLEIAEHKKKVVALDSRRKKWEEGERILSFVKQAESRDAYRLFFGLDESFVQNAENLERRREVLDQKAAKEYDVEKEKKYLSQAKQREKAFGILLFSGVGIVVFAVLFAVLRLQGWQVWTTLSGLLGIAFTIIGFLKMQREKSTIWKITECIKGIQTAVLGIEKEAEDVEKELSTILSQYNCKNSEELRKGFLLCKQAEIEAEGYRRTYRSMMEGEDVEALSSEVQKYKAFLDENLEILALDIDAELHKNRGNQMECVARIKESESKLSYVFRETVNPADVETEIFQIKETIDQLEKRYKALEIAVDVFKNVIEKRKSDFTPKVNEKVNHFLGILTDGKYQEARVSQEYQLRLIPDKTHLYQAEFFSTGTYEQIYFALRLSLATLLGSGTEPLFLDDFLTSYDDERAEQAVNLLVELAKNHQVFFFTCHQRDVENAKKRDVMIRYLEEDRNDGC